MAYFDALRAPFKKLVWFDDSAHEAFVDEPGKFNATMLELVRPLAIVPVTASAPPRLPLSA